MESQLQGLWAQVLGIDAASISANDHFFRKGGDSIAAMRLLGAARDSGVALAIADIFQKPHLSNFARTARPIASDIYNSTNEAFTLLNCGDLDDFLRNEIESKTSFLATEIVDVVPDLLFKSIS